jgi:hypothetical protein
MPLVGLVLEGLGLPPPRNGVRCGAPCERGEISLEAVRHATCRWRDMRLEGGAAARGVNWPPAR